VIWCSCIAPSSAGPHLGQGDLVGEDDFLEQRALDELELALVVDVGAGEVAGQQVGGELDAAEAAMDGGGERLHGGRLGQPQRAFDQHVTVGEQADDQPVEQILLADDERRQRIAQFKDARLSGHGGSARMERLDDRLCEAIAEWTNRPTFAGEPDWDQ